MYLCVMDVFRRLRGYGATRLRCYSYWAMKLLHNISICMWYIEFVCFNRIWELLQWNETLLCVFIFTYTTTTIKYRNNKCESDLHPVDSTTTIPNFCTIFANVRTPYLFIAFRFYRTYTLLFSIKSFFFLRSRTLKLCPISVATTVQRTRVL